MTMAGETVLVVSGMRLLRERVADMIVSRGLQAVPVAPYTLGTRGQSAAPGFAIVDVRDAGAAACVRLLSSSDPPVRVLVVGSVEHVPGFFACLEAGAAGVLDDECGEQELWDALTRVRIGDVIVSPRVLAALLQRASVAGTSVHDAPLGRLTSREQQVLSLMGSGYSNKEIGAALHITLGTVKHHVHRILEKLQVPRRSAAVALARGTVPPAMP